MKNYSYRHLGVLALIFLMGCRDAAKPSAGPDLVVDPRGGLIAALKELRREAASKDSSVVAGMFRFPIPDSAIRISGDSVFENAKVGGNISRELFLSGYGEFVQELQYPELLDAFRNLDVNKLNAADSVGFEEKGKRCIKGFYVRVLSDSVVEIQAYQNASSGYTGQGSADGSDCEEYLLTWEFVYDGKRLYMIDHSEAD